MSSVMIEQLLELYRIDTELVGLKKRLQAGPEEVKLREDKVEAAREERRKAQEAIRTKATEVDACNLEVREAESEIASQQGKLQLIKNNKEYKIVTDRIKELKERVGRREEEALAKMEQLDAAKAELKARQDDLAREEAAVAALQAEVAKEKAEISARQAELKQKRDIQVGRVNETGPDALGVYMAALRRNSGDAMAAMSDGTCQSCFRRQSPNVVNIVTLGKDLKKMICGGCGRILYGESGA